MVLDTKSDIPEAEARMLRHEAFIAEVLQRITRPDTEDKLKPKWQRFLETSGGAALITVLIGGLFGQIITCSIQKQLKDREFAQAVMKTRSDQAILTHSEYLRQELEIVKRAQDLIGSYISASEDLITLTGPDFVLDPQQYNQKELDDLKKQRKEIRDNYNTITTQWRAEHEKVGLLMSYYHHGKPEVAQSWDELQEAVTKYVNCSKKWYYDHPYSTDYTLACDNENKALKEKLIQLQSTLEAVRQFAWTGAESLKDLKSELDK